MCVRLAILGMALVVAAAPAAACSPIVPLSILYSGPTVGAMVIGAGAGLALVVAVKCGLFATLCRELHPARAAGLMFLANAATTVLGVAIALGPASGGGLFTLPVVIWAAIRTSNHLDRRRGVAGGLIGLFFLSCVLWAVAEYAGGAGGSSAAYWGLKFAYTACAVAVGFVMTAAWEAYLVQRWSLLPATARRVPRPERRPRLDRALGRAARAERDRP
ncbi:unnamed protein product, partial [marine sediment metagenome]